MRLSLPNSAQEQAAARSSSNRWYAWLVMVVAALTNVKAGPVQIGEGVLFLGLPIMLNEIAASRVFLARFQSICSPLCLGLFFVFVVISAGVGYAEGGFVVPSDATSILQQPGWISAARIIQLLLVVTAFAWVLKVALSDPAGLRLCVRWYVFAAAISSIYGIISWTALFAAGIDLGGAYGQYGVRLKAFFVEGGPFGLYAISALAVLVGQWQLQFIPRKLAIGCSIVLVTAFIMAQSKSATFSILIVCIASVFICKRRLSKAQIAAIIALALLVIVSALLTGADQIGDLLMDRRDALLLHSDRFHGDANITMGRIAGSVIVPDMIRSNPILGVGIGNYSLLRDSSVYNPSLPAVDAWDLHGLGLYGFTAEVGIPAAILFSIFFLKPVWIIRQNGGSAAVIALRLAPFVSFLFGVQPTFLYPWIVLALGIGLSSTEQIRLVSTNARENLRPARSALVKSFS